MTRQYIKFIFKKIEEQANLDFAWTKGYCCSTCTWADIHDEFGENAKGIWLKWYDKGGNKSKWDNNATLYVAHDLTPKQKDIVYEILAKHFVVDWDKKDDNKCIILNKKGETK